CVLTAQLAPPHVSLSISRAAPHRDLHSFPTRRSSDLVGALVLHGLKNANGFAELFARFRVFHGDIERAVHSAYHFGGKGGVRDRSEEDTSELQSLRHLVCPPLLEKKTKPVAAPDT